MAGGGFCVSLLALSTPLVELTLKSLSCRCKKPVFLKSIAMATAKAETPLAAALQQSVGMSGTAR